MTGAGVQPGAPLLRRRIAVSRVGQTSLTQKDDTLTKAGGSC